MVTIAGDTILATFIQLGLITSLPRGKHNRNFNSKAIKNIIDHHIYNFCFFGKAEFTFGKQGEPFILSFNSDPKVNHKFIVLKFLVT